MKITFTSIPLELKDQLKVSVDYMVKFVLDDKLVLENGVVVLINESDHFTLSFSPINVGHLTAEFYCNTGKIMQITEDENSSNFVTVDILTGLPRLKFMGILDKSNYDKLHFELDNAKQLSNILYELGLYS